MKSEFRNIGLVVRRGLKLEGEWDQMGPVIQGWGSDEAKDKGAVIEKGVDPETSWENLLDIEAVIFWLLRKKGASVMILRLRFWVVEGGNIHRWQ